MRRSGSRAVPVSSSWQARGLEIDRRSSGPEEPLPEFVRGTVPNTIDRWDTCSTPSVLPWNRTFTGTPLRMASPLVSAFALILLCNAAAVQGLIVTRRLGVHCGYADSRRARDVVMASRLPEAVYRLLPDVILRTPADAAAVAALWRAVCKVYPSEEAAAAAVVNTPSLILPWVNTPSNVAGSFAVLVDILDSTESAQDVISKNPGILACNPQRLALSSAGEIKAVAAIRATLSTLARPLSMLGLGVVVLGSVAFSGSLQGTALDPKLPESVVVGAQQVVKPVIGAVGALGFFAAAAVAVSVNIKGAPKKPN